jgi:DNA-directed RNA polymerase specialized sigma24 family protein
MRKHIKSQKTKEVQGKPFHGERSPFWDYMDSRAGEFLQEPAQANPDVLPETEIAAPSTPQLLMGEAVQHLQGRQKEVYLLTMREGKSLSEVAEILDISKGTAQVYRDRAVKFIEIYCREAIKRGRV